MKDLIEALQIMMKYCGDDLYPTHCEDDTLCFPNIDYDAVSDEDKKRLEKLGFIKNTNLGCVGLVSYRYS